MSSEYIYLLQPLQSITNNEDIYKIGKTKRNNFKRFNEYPSGSVLLLQTSCINCDLMEKKLLKLFNEIFTKRTDYGREYFKGDLVEMKKLINYEIINEKDGNYFIDDTILVESSDKVTNSKNNYCCEYCSFKSNHRRDYNKHLLTAKHQRFTNDIKNCANTTNKNICICGKEYKNRHTLSRHRRYCDYKEDNSINEPLNNSYQTMIIDIIKDNRDIKSLLLEHQKESNELIKKLINISDKDKIIKNISKEIMIDKEK
jgi:hypothetical protein